jgi:hypothetical protein
MGETDGAAAAWDAEYRAGPRAHPGGPGAGSRRRPVLLRVNATGTDIWPEHEVTERHPDGGLTVRYLAGPKRHLLIHFFSAAELGALFGSGFEPVVQLRPQHTWRATPEPAGGPSGKPSGGG